MVTFNCEVCNDTVPKKNTEKHYYRCPNAYYTCIDCSKTFEDGVSYKNHTSCISEDEKYQKALYKGNKKAEAEAAAAASGNSCKESGEACDQEGRESGKDLERNRASQGQVVVQNFENHEVKGQKRPS